MNVEAFCLCKAVLLNRLNQPSLIDMFDVKEAAGEPVLVDPFIVIGSIRFYRTDVGDHHFKFLLKEDSGKVLISSTEIVSISALPKDSTTFFLQCHMGQTGVKFGTYHFSLEYKEKQIAHTPLYVVKATR